MVNTSSISSTSNNFLSGGLTHVKAEDSSSASVFSGRLGSNSKNKEVIKITKDGVVKATYDSNGKLKSEDKLNAEGKAVSRKTYTDGKLDGTFDLDSDGNIKKSETPSVKADSTEASKSSETPTGNKSSFGFLLGKNTETK